MRDGSSRCEAHKVEQWTRRADIPKRITGRRLQAQRAALFLREPFCRECAKQGVQTVATIRDHITPLAENGSDADSNIQPLCQACGDVKTEGEARRGRGGGQVLGAAEAGNRSRRQIFACAKLGVGGVKP